MEVYFSSSRTTKVVRSPDKGSLPEHIYQAISSKQLANRDPQPAIRKWQSAIGNHQ
jgi:hypothetical protein